MVELIINGNKIELPKDTSIKYTKQISDIFDLANVACSYTTSFEFEKTPRNTQTMQFLGINGDSSNIPYIKNEALLKVDGFDLSNFEHEKNMTTVIASFSNEYYNYIIADYGGKTIFNDGINIDYLAPCFSVRKIWELIFSTFGFNCDYTYLSYFDGLYITYPQDVNQEQSLETVATMHKNPYQTLDRTNIAGFTYT